MKKEIIKFNNEVVKLPFVLGTQYGGLIFLSGMVSKDLNTDTPILGTIEEETAQVLHNIKFLLEKAGSSAEKILKTTVYLADMEYFEGMNRVYRDFFSNPSSLAARSTVGTKLVREFKIEIDVIATL